MPPDIQCGVHLETEVENTDGTTSAIIQAVSNDQVLQAQRISLA